MQTFERVTIQFDEIIDYTVIILSRNHEKFLHDCLSSINRELSDAKVICVDIGSLDSSFSHGKQLANKFGLNSKHIELHKDTKTLTVLKKLESFIDTKYIILISADDVLGKNYRISLKKLRMLNPQESVINFTSTMTDQNLIPFGEKKPHWRDTSKKNRNLLSYSNPGTAPGAVIPWQALIKLDAWRNPPDILIEDYWIWWQLIDFVPFLNCHESEVLYRQHKQSISRANKNKDYAFSLGYVTAIPNIRADKPWTKFLSLLLIVRWIRHLNYLVWKNYAFGYVKAKKNYCLT